MIEDLERTFTGWAKRPGKTEIEKCENAERIIKKAIEAFPKLQDKTISVFSHGSYKNNTNVRVDSDIDICVLCEDSQFSGLNDGLTYEELGLENASYSYNSFKADVEAALVSYFGTSAVNCCNKHFDLKENSYRVDADIVACMNFRRYHINSNGDIYHHLGCALIPDRGSKIVNWPYQNYDNGVDKNKKTGFRFKKIVRILKKLRDSMVESGITAAKNTSSFQIESLVWNVPDDNFENEKLVADVRATLAYLFNNTRSDETCNEWGEINELQYLIRGVGKRERVHAFVDAAWEYLDLK